MNRSLAEFIKQKLIAPLQLADKTKELRHQKKTIATLNGSFDILHAGHLEIIYQASLQASTLIVALNSDASIRSYKGPDRPFISLEDRLSLMGALAFVDYVTWFDELDPCRLLSVIQPDVHVNGAEYGENCIEAETVKQYGGRIHIVPLVPGLSTSHLVNKIRQI